MRSTAEIVASVQVLAALRGYTVYERRFGPIPRVWFTWRVWVDTNDFVLVRGYSCFRRLAYLRFEREFERYLWMCGDAP